MSVAKKSRVWMPWVVLSLLILTSLLVLEGGQVVTQANSPPGDDAVLLDAHSRAQAPLSLAKTAWPAEVVNGEMVTFTVMVSNTGMVSGTLDAIVDTLDPGLTFSGMLTGSDVISEPQVISNTLTWTGPFTVPAGSALTLLYQVETDAVEAPVELCNSVEVSTTETVPPPAAACVSVESERFTAYLPWTANGFRLASLEVAKTVFPESLVVDPAAELVYTVTVVNVGHTPGVLLAVNDTLPDGFSFLGMAPGSDVPTDPAGTSGTITWNGNWAMPPGGQLDLVYRVRPSETPGQYTNSVTVVSSDAYVPGEPAEATVVLKPGNLFEEDFNDPAAGIGRWTKFMNYHRLEEGQWSWKAMDGVAGSGAATQDCWLSGSKTIGHDALLMYLDQEAADWTDYRVEAEILLRGGIVERNAKPVVSKEGGYPLGLWVRGQYRDVGDSDSAGWVTGYYVVVGGRPSEPTMFVRLMQLQTQTDCWGPACENPHNLYDFNNPYPLHEVSLQRTFQRNEWYNLAVEVRGANIKVYWEGDLVIDYTDTKQPFLKGTIGFKTYKSKTASLDNVVVTPLSD